MVHKNKNRKLKAQQEIKNNSIYIIPIPILLNRIMFNRKTILLNKKTKLFLKSLKLK